MDEKPIRVIIADDHPAMLKGIVTILNEEEGFEVVATDATGRNVLELCHKTLPDIAILDISMPEGGLLLAPKIVSSCPSIKIVYYSMYVEGPLLKRAFCQTIHGYIHKGDPNEFIPLALHEVYNGKYYFSSSISNFIAEMIFDKRDTLPHEKLSKAEMQIFWLILENKNSQKIADKLGKGKRTVEGQRTTIYEKLGCKNKEGIFQYAQKNNLISSQNVTL